MKTKTKKISLLAISTIALAMPFAASAVTNVTTYSTNGTAISTNVTFSNDSFTGAPVTLSSQGSITTTLYGLTGSGTTNTYFTVDSSAKFFSATENIVPTSPTTATLYDSTTGQTISFNATSNGAYATGALKAGDSYDYIVAYNTSAPSTLSTSLIVAAIPEPEQWAMMMIGLFLVAAKVTKYKKSATLLMPFNI
jgi:hypothetical protein